MEKHESGQNKKNRAETRQN